MEQISNILKEYDEKGLPDLRPGDIIRVHQKIKEGEKDRIAVFEGRIIALKHGRGLDGTFTVRKVAEGVGVEKIFPWHLPSIIKIERVKSAKTRRAKLYFVRHLQAKKLKRLKEKAVNEVWQREESKPEEPEKATPERKEAEPEKPELGGPEVKADSDGKPEKADGKNG